MRTSFFIKMFRFMVAGVLLCSLAANAVVTWNGAIAPPTLIVDEDINITGDCTINEGIIVKAATADITIDVSADAVLEGKLTGTVEPRLFLLAGPSRKITVNVDNNLLFTGDSDTDTRLLISIEGDGEVEFILADGKKVSFTSSDAEHAGTRLFVHGVDGVSFEVGGPGAIFWPQSPTLRFSRSNTNSTENVEVLIGPKSLMSYILSPAGSEASGSIIFDPANVGSGRMLLRIEDGGGVCVGNSLAEFTLAGNYVEALSQFFLSDIDMMTPVLGDFSAQFIVTNSIGSSATSGLLVLNNNSMLPDLYANPWSESSSFGGHRFGFVLVDQMIVQDNAYFDYVGLTNNLCPNPTIPEDLLMGRLQEQIVKARNASAFIVDGPAKGPHASSIQMGDAAAVFFRSGVDKDGSIRSDFTIDPINKTSGAGEVVFDVEGLLLIDGSESRNNKFEILSWQVAPSGGSVLIGGSETIFPLRTFAKDSGDYLQYNAACALINNRMELNETHLVHTDGNHNVYEKDDVISEPTYIGGESYELSSLLPLRRAIIDPSIPSGIFTLITARPKIVFYDSVFMIHTDVALTGLDLLVPNGGGDSSNESIFRFFQNGTAYRDGTGRHMILGTQVGSSPCNACCSALSRDVHLDVMQDVPQDSVANHILTLETADNDATIHDNLPSVVAGQAEIHTIYLGHASNISIGSFGDSYVSSIQDDPPFTLVTYPVLSIEGSFFSFETRGGPETSPETSAVSGRGGMFIDTNGTVQIDSHYRANMALMITKSGNASISLPRTNVFFDNRVAIADWKLDLTDASQRVVVESNEALSDYTLNWRDVTKDYNNFTPYENNYSPCNCPTVGAENVASLPTIEGFVDQLHVKGSRLGEAVHVKIDSGWVRELVLLAGCDSADAPTGIVVLKNDGRVGLGSAHRNRDSLGASYKLGMNGVTIIADGDGRVDLNEDIIIDNVCHILRGPNFDPPSFTFDKLQFYSDCGRQLVVKGSGVLDLRSFTAENHIVEFAGNSKLILEPGARVLLNGGTLRATDNARIEVVPVSDIGQFEFGSDTTSIDPIRVALTGTGKIVLLEDSVFIVEDNAYVGVENYASCEIFTTDIEIDVRDRAKMMVGSGSGIANSAFQIGNTSDLTQFEGSVSFTLNLSGVNSLFSIASRGFFGLGVGIVDNSFVTPSDWLVDTLYNVSSISILVPAGTFKHDRIFNSDNAYASLLAIGSTVSELTFNNIGAITGDTTQSTILGGGNMVLIAEGEGAVNPTVQVTDGDLSSRLTAGMFSSKAVLDIKAALVNPTTPAGLFNFWKTPNNFPTQTMYANAAQDEHNLLTVGYVDGTNIQRLLTDEIVGQAGIKFPQKDFRHSLELGSVFIDIGIGVAPRTLISVFELP